MNLLLPVSCFTCVLTLQVLRNGELLEYGEPYDLLCNPDSYLLRLVDQTGPTSAEKLKMIALNVHNEKCRT